MNWIIKYYQLVRLTNWHHLFLEFWLVNTWFFARWRHQHAVTRLENVRQLNIMPGKKLGFQLSHRQPPIIRYRFIVSSISFLTSILVLSVNLLLFDFAFFSGCWREEVRPVLWDYGLEVSDKLLIFCIR